MDRHGMELAIGTLVVIILGIIIVGMGITLIYMVLDLGEETIDAVTDSQRSELRQLIASGDLVAVTPGSVKIRAGESAIFAAGIENRLKKKTYFSISMKGLDEARGEITWHTYLEPGPIDPNQYSDFLVIISVPVDALPGTYTFIVKVTYEELPDSFVQYDSKRFFTVIVR
ncbi:hypothetical protein GOV11_00055 [Candidatus Woesearchaeota archaeon]|nr:hypothetical protein [Candidatus Woesearchaeota archaeon]